MVKQGSSEYLPLQYLQLCMVRNIGDYDVNQKVFLIEQQELSKSKGLVALLYPLITVINIDSIFYVVCFGIVGEHYWATFISHDWEWFRRRWQIKWELKITFIAVQIGSSCTRSLKNYRVSHIPPRRAVKNTAICIIADYNAIVCIFEYSTHWQNLDQLDCCAGSWSSSHFIVDGCWKCCNAAWSSQSLFSWLLCCRVCYLSIAFTCILCFAASEVELTSTYKHIMWSQCRTVFLLHIHIQDWKF